MKRIKAVFGGLSDPRAANVRHDLVEVLVVALAATLCGARNCAEMAEFGRAKEAALRRVLDLAHGVPSHDTFSRVLRLLEPLAFEAAFRRFTAAFARANRVGEVVAVDGKALRGAYLRGRRCTPLQMVNVWACGARMALAQRKAPGRKETDGALEALALLSLKGAVVTADALHCTRAMAAAVLDRGGHYVLALKSNRRLLLAEAKACLRRAPSRDRARERPAAAHGRRERREAVVVPAAPAMARLLPGVRAVAAIRARRQPQDGPAVDTVRHFLLSRPMSAARLLRVVRAHWGIENSLHWVLDVVFGEDKARNRMDASPENHAVLRKLALNILQAHPARTSITIKVKRAAWDDRFLFELLGHMR